MKRIFLTLLLSTATIYADDANVHQSCSLATLRGEYGFSIAGSRPSGPHGPIEQILGVALTTFNGDGTLAQVDNIHGSISGYPASAENRPGKGTYMLGEDCNGTMTLENEGSPKLSLRIVVVNDGHEVRAVVVEPAVAMVTSNGVRVHP
ncbi:MAG: hypothetical protein JO270_02815 [Acidobacteriaceae bacterium]|nr:hypothetical protein [Acidobacteriaceae bacterium]MBV8571503.1 hypothetical protein [Acidobacteriaceae bacterium]